ncbi:myTH4 domain-containing protein [Ditylenchus destructor]|nr:myTH4 domain-containing protein [Ditylenchus destructor]
MDAPYGTHRSRSQSRFATDEFPSLGRDHRSKSLDNRNAPLDGEPPQGYYYSREPAAARRSGDSFFNESVTIPIQHQQGPDQESQARHYRSAHAGLDQYQGEEKAGQFQTYDKQVRYNHEKTLFPPTTQRHYLNETYSNRALAPGPPPSSISRGYPESSDYDAYRVRERAVDAPYRPVAAGTYAYDSRYSAADGAGLSTFGRSAAKEAHRSQHYHREAYHQSGGGARSRHQQHQYGMANGGWGQSSSRGAFAYRRGTVSPKPPTVHHKVRCCCFSLKWPPWGYEETEPPRQMFYSRQGVSARSPLYTTNYYDERQSLYGYNGDANRFTMAEFAALYFRRSKHFAGDTFSLQRKKKEWTWKDITDKIKFSSRPINHSLLNLQSSEADKMAQDAFLCIMRYMGDEGLKRGQSYTDCIYELLSLCHRYVPLRDEIYCQLVKQVTSNKSQNPDSLVRGWRLISIVTAYFACSETMRPYLVKYLDDIAEDNRRVFYGLANQCRLHLAQTFRYGGRRFILGAAEVEATTNGKNIRRQVYHLPGGHRKIIYTRPITVAEEIVQELCLDMNVRSNEEQQEFSLCYVLEEDNSMKFLNNDEYVMDVITELDSRKEEYTFILTRIVFIHPLRQDSDLYSDALFFQIMPNYIAGLLNSLNNGMVSAAVLNDITRLGALLLLSDPAFNVSTREHDISPSSISSLVPKTIIQFANISVEQWVDRIQSKCKELSNDYTPILARQQFLETVEKWQLFGAAFFFVKRTVTKRNEHLDCILSINKGGVRVLANETHEILSEYPLEEIASTNKYSLSERQFFEIHLTNLASQKYGYDVITIETDLGAEIARLLGQYLYLSKESRKEPIYIANGQK